VRPPLRPVWLSACLLAVRLAAVVSCITDWRFSCSRDNSLVDTTALGQAKLPRLSSLKLDRNRLTTLLLPARNQLLELFCSENQVRRCRLL